jgi:hypothetical protein
MQGYERYLDSWSDLRGDESDDISVCQDLSRRGFIELLQLSLYILLSRNLPRWNTTRQEIGHGAMDFGKKLVNWRA